MKQKIDKLEDDRDQSLSAADVLAQHIERLHVQLFQEDEQRSATKSPDVGNLRKGLTQLNKKLELEKQRRIAAENEAKLLVNENHALAHNWEQLHGRRGAGRGEGGINKRRESAKHQKNSLRIDDDGDSAVASTVSGSYVKLPPEAFNSVIFTPAQSPTAAAAAVKAKPVEK